MSVRMQYCGVLMRLLLQTLFILVTLDLSMSAKHFKRDTISDSDSGKKEVRRLVKEQNRVLLDILTELRSENLRQTKQDRVLNAILTCFSCSHDARCKQEGGQMKCVCEPGFIGDGTRCVKNEFEESGLFQHGGLDPFNTSWYFVSSFSAEWEDAREICQRYGADLASLDSTAEWRHVFDAVALNDAGDFHWLGARIEDDGITWRWLNGTKISRFHTSWRDGMPEFSRQGDDCLLMQDVRTFAIHNSWRDYRCSAKFKFICEKVIETRKLLMT